MSRLIGMKEYRRYLPLQGPLQGATWSTRYSGRTRSLYAAFRSVAVDLPLASRSLLGQSSASLMLFGPFSWLMSVLSQQGNTATDVALTSALLGASHSTHHVTFILLTNHPRFHQWQQNHPTVSYIHCEQL